MRAEYRHYGCRITDELTYKNMRVLYMENELIKIGILLDKGADIFQLIHKPTDTDFLWRSPNGLLDPDRNRDSIAPSTGSFLDTYHGGWQTVFPGGGPYNHDGAEIGLHGEISMLSWDYDIKEDTVERIEVKFLVNCLRTPFRVQRTIALESNQTWIQMQDEITNLSPKDMKVMWGQHPAFGSPFLKKGNKVFVNAKKFIATDPKFMESGIFEAGQTYDWPVASLKNETIDLSVIGEDTDGFGELLYLTELKEGWCACVDPVSKLGLGFAWPVDIYPYLWFWLVYGNAPGYPWWDRVYCIALEPWTSYPNSYEKALQNGTLRLVKGGETVYIPFTAVVITDQESVSRIDLDGKVSK